LSETIITSEFKYFLGGACNQILSCCCAYTWSDHGFSISISLPP